MPGSTPSTRSVPQLVDGVPIKTKPPCVQEKKMTEQQQQPALKSRTSQLDIIKASIGKGSSKYSKRYEELVLNEHKDKSNEEVIKYLILAVEELASNVDLNTCDVEECKEAVDELETAQAGTKKLYESIDDQWDLDFDEVGDILHWAKEVRGCS